MSTHTANKSTCPIVWLLMLLPTNDPLSASLNAGAYESDPVIDIHGLLSLVDIWLHLVASPRRFVFVGSVLPLPYSLNRHSINITVLALESPSSSSMPWSKDDMIILLEIVIYGRLASPPARWHALLVCTDG